jgi:peptide deformylase
MLLQILKYGAPELKKVSVPVDHYNGELERLAKNMIETMYGAPGIGLAAAQVGVNLCLATVDLSVGEDPDQLIVICNPEIVTTEGEQKSEEGCLSIPDFSDTITRPRKLVIKGTDLHGEPIQHQGEGLLARCFCHEIDHMNGLLFIDHLSPLKRKLIRSKIKKLAESGEW